MSDEADGAVVCLGDMPLIDAQLIDRLIDALRRTAANSIAVPVADGRRGNPVLWSRRFFRELMTLDGDIGARHLIAKHGEAVTQVPVEGDSAFLDIDTPAGTGSRAPGVSLRGSPFSTFRSPSGNDPRLNSPRTALGEGILIVSTAKAQRRALFILALTLLLAGSRYVSESWAAGSLAVGKCGAYGQAFDYPAEDAARIAALKQCKGQCTAMTMKRACAALAIDLKNPCGPHGYAVKPKISPRSMPPPASATNSAARNALSAPGPATPGDDGGPLSRLSCFP